MQNPLSLRKCKSNLHFRRELFIFGMVVPRSVGWWCLTFFEKVFALCFGFDLPESCDFLIVVKM